MLYDIDSFGFVAGYVSKNWNIMSKEDLLADRRLARRLHETKYQLWKRRNVMELHEQYEKTNYTLELSFDKFCREIFKRIRN